jgi:hypothetical protein
MKIKIGTTIRGVNLFADIRGLDDLVAAIKNVPDTAREAAAGAINDAAQDLKAKAVERTPIKTGDLRGTAFADEATPDNLDAAVGFGYAGTRQFKYALRQHEELTWKHPQGGEAKYLENPFKENVDKYTAHISEAVKKAVDGG